MTLELTDLVNEFVATKCLSKIELDFLECEHWELHEYINEITSLTSAKENISKELKLKDRSSLQLCCAAVLDASRPEKRYRTEKLKN